MDDNYIMDDDSRKTMYRVHVIETVGTSKRSAFLTGKYYTRSAARKGMVEYARWIMSNNAVKCNQNVLMSEPDFDNINLIDYDDSLHSILVEVKEI